MYGPKYVCFVVLLVWLHQTWAFPSIFVARYGKECTDHPSSDYGKVHEYTSSPDKSATFSVISTSTGKAVSGKICAGDSYTVQVDFGEPSKRNFLLTSSQGSLSGPNDCDHWCGNRICSTGPSSQAKATLSVPCDLAGSQLALKVTSANGRTPTPGSTLRSNTLTLEVDGKCSGKCSSGSKGSTGKVTDESSRGGTSSSSSSSGNKKVNMVRKGP